MKKENGKIIDASSRFEEARKKADVKKVAEILKENLQKDGLEVIDPNEFFDAIQQVKEAPLMPFILAAKNCVARVRPNLFKDKGINLDNVEEKINKIYGKNGEETESILYSLKQILKHVVYFLETNPDEEELDNTIKSLKILLSGKWYDQK
ncbi:MAG: hypothetical protein NTX00_05585 [Candidatus Parcubacteria bacterium]|nr:hypothetical protein [Candidatus Parcubacteria bacterium]